MRLLPDFSFGSFSHWLSRPNWLAWLHEDMMMAFSLSCCKPALGGALFRVAAHITVYGTDRPLFILGTAQ